MPLTKRFTRIRNSFGLIFDQPILKQADMDPETAEVEISVEDHAIVLRPHRYPSERTRELPGARSSRSAVS